MEPGYWLLLIGCTVVGVLLCVIPFLGQCRRDARAATSHLPAVFKTHKAVMTVWLQMQAHLDELEQSGVEVTPIRDDLRQTVESVLTSQIRSGRVELELISDSVPPEIVFPIAVGRFGSLRIFG